MSLTKSILEGNRLALARLLTQVENDLTEGHSSLAELFPYTGKAHLIGVTGAPGTGKSSLVNQLALQYRKTTNKKVAIIAVEPMRLAEPGRSANVKCSGGIEPTLDSNPQATATPFRTTSRNS